MFFNDTATTEIYTLSLHDALPISRCLPVRLPYRLLTREHRAQLRAPAHFLGPRLEPGRNEPAPGALVDDVDGVVTPVRADRKSTRLNSSHANISYAVFCLKKNKPV